MNILGLQRKLFGWFVKTAFYISRKTSYGFQKFVQTYTLVGWKREEKHFVDIYRLKRENFLRRKILPTHLNYKFFPNISPEFSKSNCCPDH